MYNWTNLLGHLTRNLIWRLACCREKDQKELTSVVQVCGRIEVGHGVSIDCIASARISSNTAPSGSSSATSSVILPIGSHHNRDRWSCCSAGVHFRLKVSWRKWVTTYLALMLYRPSSFFQFFFILTIVSKRIRIEHGCCTFLADAFTGILPLVFCSHFGLPGVLSSPNLRTRSVRTCQLFVRKRLFILVGQAQLSSRWGHAGAVALFTQGVLHFWHGWHGWHLGLG